MTTPSTAGRRCCHSPSVLVTEMKSGARNTPPTPGSSIKRLGERGALGLLRVERLERARVQAPRGRAGISGWPGFGVASVWMNMCRGPFAASPVDRRGATGAQVAACPSLAAERAGGLRSHDPGPALRATFSRESGKGSPYLISRVRRCKNRFPAAASSGYMSARGKRLKWRIHGSGSGDRHDGRVPHGRGRARRSREAHPFHLRRQALRAASHGDTLATALIANGVHLMGRSFKYHRPRGPLSLGSEEPNALVDVDAGKGRVTPNLRATQVELYEGLKRDSQNAWPSLQFDAMAVNGALSAFFPAGFYYKTFIGPPGAWEHLYEPAIRRAAGLGVAPDRAGPRPLRLRTSPLRRRGRRRRPGGPRGGARRGAGGRSRHPVRRAGGVRRLAARRGAVRRSTASRAAEWVAERRSRNWRPRRNVTLLPRTQVFGYYAQNFLAAEQRVTDHLAYPDPRLPRERLWQVRAKRVDRRDRRARAAAGVPRQRPARASCWPTPRGRSRSATA